MNIAPALRYKDAPGAIGFLTRAFGFEVIARFDGPGNTVAHAQLAVDGGAIMLSTRGPEVAANPWTRVDQGLYVQISEPDAHYARASGAGAEIIMPLRDTEHGSREYSAKDSEGIYWAFGTYPTGAKGHRTSLFPGLSYARAKAAGAFLEDVFGFESTLEVLDEKGRLVHAELRLGPGIVMIGQDTDGNGMWGRKLGTFIALPDPDAHHARALAEGARVLKPPHDTPYDARAYYVADPEGFIWGFSTYRPA